MKNRPNVSCRQRQSGAKRQRTVFACEGFWLHRREKFRNFGKKYRKVSKTGKKIKICSKTTKNDKFYLGFFEGKSWANTKCKIINFVILAISDVALSGFII